MNSMILKRQALAKAESVNLAFDPKTESLVLKAPMDGTLLSEVISTDEPFNDLVASWNTCTPPGTEAEIYARLLVEGRWSSWMSWGRWSTFIRRCCPDQEDGLVWANAYRDGGDSSVNVKDGKLASAFQLKAVLRACADAKEMPSLSLLCASWKNTNDPEWPKKCSLPEDFPEQKSLVKLDTPAVSQKRRDPYYGGVICSATSIAMQLCGCGIEVLPEEAVFAGLDYGFGGNGNWSYTTATAGAYGAESYAAYIDFKDLRSELSAGNAVGLSVKYSYRRDQDVPYLENATGTTHGHLIVCTGYRYSEELGEYVYLINDPAGGYDLSCTREYRQSQLDKAWYRRMAYICRRKDKAPSSPAFIRKDAQLNETEPGAFELFCEGKRINMPIDFLREKCTRFGNHGTIYWYVEGDLSELAEGVRRCEANRNFHYEGIIISERGEIKSEGNMFGRLKSKGKSIVVGVLDNAGVHYTARL